MWIYLAIGIGLLAVAYLFIKGISTLEKKSCIMCAHLQTPRDRDDWWECHYCNNPGAHIEGPVMLIGPHPDKPEWCPLSDNPRVDLAIRYKT